MVMGVMNWFNDVSSNLQFYLLLVHKLIFVELEVVFTIVKGLYKLQRMT